MSVCLCVCRRVRWNILEQHTRSYLRSCNYNRESDDLCPIFRIGDVVSEAHDSSDIYDDKYTNISVFVRTHSSRPGGVGRGRWHVGVGVVCRAFKLNIGNFDHKNHCPLPAVCIILKFLLLACYSIFRACFNVC